MSTTRCWQVLYSSLCPLQMPVPSALLLGRRALGSGDLDQAINRAGLPYAQAKVRSPRTAEQIQRVQPLTGKNGLARDQGF